MRFSIVVRVAVSKFHVRNSQCLRGGEWPRDGKGVEIALPTRGAVSEGMKLLGDAGVTRTGVLNEEMFVEVVVAEIPLMNFSGGRKTLGFRAFPLSAERLGRGTGAIICSFLSSVESLSII
jgi:hypothetical protein